MPAYYPVFLDIRSRRCVVFGGNHDAERKVRYLLDCGGSVTVFAEQISEGLESLAGDGALKWVERGYEAGDLDHPRVVGANTLLFDDGDPLHAETLADAGRALCQ